MSKRFNDNKKIVNNTLVLYFRTAITMVVSFYTTRLTLELLGVVDFGLNNLVASIITLLGFINGSMGTAVQRFFAIELGENEGKNISKIFGVSLYLHIIVAIISLFIAEIFAIFFISYLNIPTERLNAAQIVFQVSIVSFILNIIIVPYTAFLRAKEEFSKIAIIDLIQSFLRLGLVFVLFYIDYDKIIALSLSNFFLTILYILSVLFLIKDFKYIKFYVERDSFIIKDMLKFISSMILTVLAWLFNKQGIVIIINLFFGLLINAAFAISYQLSNLIETFIMNFKQSIIPQLMKSYGEKDFNRMNQLIFTGTKITFFLMMLISIPFFFEAEYLLKFWLKEVPKYATEFTMLAVLTINIESFYYFIYQAVHASGKIFSQQFFVSISYILSVFLIYLAFYLGADFYYTFYISIVFSLIRNFFVINNAQKVLNLNITKFFNEIIIPSLIFIFLCGFYAYINTIIFDKSLLRFILIILGNTFISALVGYLILLSKSERKMTLVFIKERLLRFK